MKIQQKSFAAKLSAFALFLTTLFSGPAYAVQYSEYGQNWSQILTLSFDASSFRDGMNGYGAVATSNDGKIVYSLVPTGIYRSNDYGSTWSNIKNQYVPIGSSIRSMDVSSDGSIIVIAESGGYVWRSTNFGNSWAKMPQIGNFAVTWQAVSVSGTGQRIILFNGQDRYISSNTGASFTKITDANYGSVGSMSASDDGSVILLVDTNNFNPCDSGVYISKNSGTTFSQITSNLPTSCGSGSSVSSVAVSGDASTLVASSYGKTLVSQNAGASWNQSTLPAGASGGNSLAISNDGSRMAMMRSSNSPLTSVDFGATFKASDTFAGASSNWLSIVSNWSGERLYMAGDNGLYTSVINELLVTSNYGTVTLLLDTCLSDTSTSTSVMAASVILLTDTASAIANSETSTYVYFSETDTALWGANYSYGSTQNAQTCGYRDMNGTVTLTRGRFMASSNSAVLSETTTNQTDFIQYIGNTETASVYSGLPCGNLNASPRNTSNVTTSCTTAIQANYQQLTYLNSIQVRDSSVKTGVLGQPSGKIYTHVKVKKSAIAGAANGTTWVAVETFTVTSS
jgi:hypothetical protein